MTNPPRPTPAFWRSLLDFAQGPESAHLAPDARASLVSVARVSLGDYSGPGGAELSATMVAALAEMDAAAELRPDVAAVRDGAVQRLVESGVLLADEPTP